MTDEIKQAEAVAAEGADKGSTEVTPAPAEPIEVPSKFKKLVEEVEAMTVLELSELVKVLEKKFGVSAAPTLAVGAPTPSGVGAEEGKSTADVELTEVGASKI